MNGRKEAMRDKQTRGGEQEKKVPLDAAFDAVEDAGLMTTYPVEVRELVQCACRCVRDADGSVWFESWVGAGERLTRVPADEHLDLLKRLRERPRDLREEERTAAAQRLFWPRSEKAA